MTDWLRLTDAQLEILRVISEAQTDHLIAVPAEMLNGNEEVMEVARVARATEPRIVLETGTQREGTMMSSRTFFVHVSPTGAEMPIGQSPVLKKEYSQGHGRFGTPDYMQTTAYILRGEGRLKMVCLSSSFGRPRTVINLYIDIGPDLEVIELTGAGGCGKFSGRGRIDKKNSLISENRSALEITDKVLKENFGYKVLQACTAASAARKGVRSIIF